MMGWIQLAVFAFQLVFRVWDAIKEHKGELKKKKTEALQSGIRGIVDRDVSRITHAFDELNRLSKESRGATPDRQERHSEPKKE